MTVLEIALIAVVFVASLLQAVTGIGYGIIAGPVLLIAMGDSAAIQVTIVLSTVISLLLCRSCLRQVNVALLKPLFGGACFGMAAGAILFAHASLEDLKWGAAVAVLAMAAISTGVLERHPLFRRDNGPRRVMVGTASGALTATLAMPGPPVAAYATAIRCGKEEIRATVLLTNLFSYPVALAMQGVTSGLAFEALPMCALLVLPVIAGTLSGHVAMKHVPERYFRWMITILLLAAAALLLTH